jgi:hypothetical protein
MNCDLLLPAHTRYMPPQPPIHKNSLFLLLDSLPFYIKYKIYKEYIEALYYYDKYLYAIHHINSKILNINILRSYVSLFLSKPHVTQYLCKRCGAFTSSYRIHRLLKNKSFAKLNKGDSFALHILMILYH